MSLIEWICNTLNCSEDCEQRASSLASSLTNCLNENKESVSKLDENKEALKTMTGLYNTKIEQYDELKMSYDKLAEGYPPEDPQEHLWNNKYPKKDIVYTGRWITVNGAKKELNIDVRNYFTPYDHKIPTVTGATNDEKALKALKWVVDNIKYVSDKPTYGEWEYWLFPFETLKTRKGDCEDGSLFLSNIMLKSGIPYWKIRNVAGDTPYGGHAYTVYLLDDNSKWVTLDWCYHQNTKEVKDRLDYKDDKLYGGIWFSWNQKYSFSEGTKATKTKTNDFLENFRVRKCQKQKK